MISRFNVLVVGLLAVAAFAFAGCGGDSNSVPPEQAVKDALEKAATITSGQSELKATINTGGLPPSFDITGGGPFDTEAKGGPAYDLDLTVQVAGTEEQLGFAAYDGKQYLTVGDKAAELEKGGSLDPSSIKTFIDSLGGYVSGAEQLEDKTVDGKTLSVYSVDVDVDKLVADAKKNGDSLADLSIPALGSVDQLADSVGDVTATIAVADDGYPHELSVNIPIQRGSSEAGVRATITLSDINQPVTIEAPENVVERSELGGIADFLGS